MTLSEESCSAKFWLLYIYYLHVLKRFIIAERTSNWSLHIPGNISYIKSARIYIQKMQSLAEKYLWLYEKFVASFHKVVRSDRCWNGLWSDLVIEQTLIRSIKTHGGFTKGRGVSKSACYM